ncbi:hypothetical protein BX600DRAFT_300711 [Xylariales sp. PMI_506]|nr:hypothetical protein BX600DRAFT_300711 [Xylariales sp. PMI_506]
MRLLDAKTLSLRHFPNADDRPPYAVLSHSWGKEQVRFADLTAMDETAWQKPGFDKIWKLCQLTLSRKLQYCWVDSCCLDAGNAIELNEAFNSVFDWFSKSTVCFVHLSDVNAHENIPESGFAESRWFSRRWTLQEFLAPRHLIYLSHDWKEIGSRDDSPFRQLASRATGIDPRFFVDRKSLSRRQLVDQASVGEKWRWASRRATTVIADMAYSMLGVFGLTMLIIPDEGGQAMERLGKLLIDSVGTSDYTSLLGWPDAIWVAASAEKEQLVQFLLENNIAPNKSDWRGYTALHFAVEKGNHAITLLLLEFGAEPNVQNDVEEIPLHLAAKYGRDRIIELLLKYGADSSLTNKLGQTALDYATRSSSREVFATPPVVDWKIIGQKRRQRLQQPPKPLTEKERVVCEKWNASVMYYGADDNSISQQLGPNIYELIYNDTDKPQRPANANYQWIHLPLNNRQWVEDLIERLCFADGKTVEYCEGIKSFVGNHFYQRIGTTARSRFRQPHFQQEWLPLSEDYHSDSGNYQRTSMAVRLIDALH